MRGGGKVNQSEGPCGLITKFSSFFKFFKYTNEKTYYLIEKLDIKPKKDFYRHKDKLCSDFRDSFN